MLEIRRYCHNILPQQVITILCIMIRNTLIAHAEIITFFETQFIISVCLLKTEDSILFFLHLGLKRYVLFHFHVIYNVSHYKLRNLFNFKTY